MISHTQHAVCIRWQIDTSYFRAFVTDDVQEAGVLMCEAIVVLTPDQGGYNNVERGNGRPPGYLQLRFLKPFGVLVVH